MFYQKNKKMTYLTVLITHHEPLFILELESMTRTKFLSDHWLTLIDIFGTTNEVILGQ